MEAPLEWLLVLVNPNNHHFYKWGQTKGCTHSSISRMGSSKSDGGWKDEAYSWLGHSGNQHRNDVVDSLFHPQCLLCLPNPCSPTLHGRQQIIFPCKGHMQQMDSTCSDQASTPQRCSNSEDVSIQYVNLLIAHFKTKMLYCTNRSSILLISHRPTKEGGDLWKESTDR
jgi:hypothetical protein